MSTNTEVTPESNLVDPKDAMAINVKIVEEDRIPGAKGLMLHELKQGRLYKHIVSGHIVRPVSDQMVNLELGAAPIHGAPQLGIVKPAKHVAFKKGDFQSWVAVYNYDCKHLSLWDRFKLLFR